MTASNNRCCRGLVTAHFDGFLAFSISLARLEMEKLMFSELFSWASGSGEMRARFSPPAFKYQWRALAWGRFRTHLPPGVTLGPGKRDAGYLEQPRIANPSPAADGEPAVLPTRRGQRTVQLRLELGASAQAAGAKIDPRLASARGNAFT